VSEEKTKEQQRTFNAAFSLCVPLAEIGLDLFEKQGKHYFISVDYLTNLSR
jgi:hypothetical protein